MSTLRELLPLFDAEMDKIQAEVEQESNELVQSVEGDVQGFGAYLSESVTTLVSSFHDDLVSDGVAPLQDELFEGVTSMAGVSMTVTERKYLIDDLATSKRVLEQIEQDTSTFQA